MIYAAALETNLPEIALHGQDIPGVFIRTLWTRTKRTALWDAVGV